MATLAKNYILTINTTQYILTEAMYKTFCLYAKQLVNNFSYDMSELMFIISYGDAEWLRISRSDDTFTVVGTGGNTEILTLQQFNSFIANCRTKSVCNCG